MKSKAFSYENIKFLKGDLKNIIEIKEFEKVLHSIPSTNPQSRSTTSRSSKAKSRSISSSPKKILIMKSTKAIQKTVKIPAVKKPVVARRGRKAKI